MPSVFIKMNLSFQGMKWRLFRFICDLRNNFLYFIGVEYCYKICFFFYFYFFKFNNVTRLLKHTHLLQTSVAFDALSGYHFHIQKIIKFSNEKLNDIIQNRAHKENWFSVVQFYIKNIYILWRILLHQSVIYYGIYINIGHFVKNCSIDPFMSDKM